MIEISADVQQTLQGQLEHLYGDAEPTLAALLELIKQIPITPPDKPISAKDVVLITYGGSLTKDGQAPLATLRDFVRDHLLEAVNTVHLLPFFPFTSDDGFSVVNYLTVDPDLGDWQDVAALASEVDLMFDAVVNHVSAKSHYLEQYLAGNPDYADFFIDVDPSADTSQVTRPRTTPLLTPFAASDGTTKHLWTTFSADQVDLNYANPNVLLEVVRVLLEYAARGARIIRLDAVTYLWKELGTTCVHHPKTHTALQLMRTIMETAAPGVLMLTETNVPHAENISYFGDGTNEAHMVYNFALPPLVLHTLLTGDSSTLSTWAKDLETTGDTCFFNFLASHDGIGVRPVEGLLNPAEIANLTQRVQAHGGHVSFKTNSDGSQSPYELNISYFDALNDPAADEAITLQVARFTLAHAIMMSLAGMPAIYIHSLLGSRSDHAGVAKTGRSRSINRTVLDADAVREALADAGSLRSQVLRRLTRLLKVRRHHRAFDPQASQQIVDISPQIFAVVRGHQHGEQVTCLHNVSAQEQRVAVAMPKTWRDLLAGKTGEGEVVLEPYQVRWLV